MATDTKNRSGILIGNIIDRMKLSVDMWRVSGRGGDITVNARDAGDLLDYIERVHDELLASRQLLTESGLHQYGSHSSEQLDRMELMEAKNETLIYSLVRMKDCDLATQEVRQ